MPGPALDIMSSLVTSSTEVTKDKVLVDIDSMSISNTQEGCTINTCGLITIETGGGLDSCKINNSIGAIAVTTEDFTPIIKNEFLSDGSNHAIELTTLGDGTLDWDNVLTDYDAGTVASPVTPTNTGNEAIYVNVGSGTIDISVSGTATVPSIRSAGATVNVIAGQVTLRVDVEDATDASIIPTARVFLHKKGEPATVYTNQECGVDGFTSDSLTYTADTDVVGWVREQNIAGTDYVQQDIAGTITSSGLTIAVKLQPI